MVSFVGPSGTGKTTLIELVISNLTARGFRIGVLKHDAHRLELDKPGKDTWRFRQAGAWRAVIVGDEQMACFSAVDGELSLGGVVADSLLDADLVITEGFRRARLPTIRVFRAAREDPHWQAAAEPIAWVSDVPQQVDAPVLPLGKPTLVADFLVDRFLGLAGTHRRATLVLPVKSAAEFPVADEMARRLGPVCEGRVLLVHPRQRQAPLKWPSVADIRPDAGPLGALLTGLATADTPYVLFVGVRHSDITKSLLNTLLEAGPRAADLVVPIVDGYPEPLLALYGHRCLASIHHALISGEYKMDGWWGQIRVFKLPA